MKRRECELARRADRDENWRQHAAGCRDCGEVLNASEWMNKFAGSTNPGRDLPSAGLLLFKARLRKKLSSAERAARPINAMAVIALLVALVSTVGVVLGTESRFGSILIEALGLLATYAAPIAFAAAATALISAAIVFILKRLEA